MNVDGDIVDGGCYGEALSDGVGGEKLIGRHADGVMKEGEGCIPTKDMQTPP